MAGFDELLYRFERNISVLGRSQSTFNCYSRHIAAMAMHFGCLPTELDSEQAARSILMDIIEDRHGKRSTIITSQLPVKQWYEVIGERTVADAILDRLLHHA